MIVQLKLNEEKVRTYNQRVAECKREYPELADHFNEVSELEDEFIPYIQIPKALDWDKYTIIEADYRKSFDFDGVYVCGLNSNHTIEALTDYREARNFDSPIYWYDYGVCDNASQVLDYYDSLYKEHEDYMKDKKFVILLSPMFREDQPESGGWRWHKWGQYIGKYEHKHAYLYDEEGIDYVYCFKILEIEEC